MVFFNIFFDLFITVCFYFISGKIFLYINTNSFQKFLLTCLIGSVFLSFIALVAHFFFKLDLLFNSIISIVLLLIFIFRYIANKKKFNINFKYCFYLSLFSFILIFAANSNRPDSGLYHYPYISYLNFEKIIIGITNINYRFGSISIIQYLQAISNNFYFMYDGMLFPLSILPSIVYLFFFSEILRLLKKTKINKIYFLYLFFSIIFFTYKMNRYGEYGNDYIGHYLVFFIIALFFKYKTKTSFFLVSNISIFTFLNKIIFFNILILPLVLFILQLKKKNLIKQSIFPSIFVLAWFLKNILVSGCLIWPAEITCFKSNNWYNTNYSSPQNVRYIKLVEESWIKGWPDQKKFSTHSEYLKNFNWIDTWLKNHGKKIIEIYIIYFFVILFFTLIFKTKKKNYVFRIYEINLKLLILIFFLTLLGSFAWINFYPSFRLGIGNITILFITIFVALNLQNNLNKKIRSIIFLSTILCISIFCMKNFIKFYKFFKGTNINSLPRYISFNNNLPEKYISIKNEKGDFLYFYTDGLCMYSKKVCTNAKIDHNLKFKIKNTYKIFYFKY